MTKFFDLSTASLVCQEEMKDLCFDDHDDDYDGDDDDDDVSRSEPLSEECVMRMLERESEYSPALDYLTRLRSAELDLLARNLAFDWLSKAHSYYSFGPLSLCLAVNYLDRFISLRELPRGTAWTMQLLAVACLSLAAKVEETCVPSSLELQVGDPKYVFEAKTIQRMELLVLDTLKWKMNAVTPCSFLDYSLKKLSNPHSLTDKFLFSTTKVLNRSMQLILCAIKGIEYLEFKPSEIAAAVAMSVSAEFQAVDFDNATACFLHLEKGRVLKCVKMIKEMSQMSTSDGSIIGVPQSPIGVLDGGCFSYKTDELTSSVGGSSSNSTFQITTGTAMIRSSETKRMKLDH
ncbi:hypothetical protein vseg_015498 [Gypsophila vaccaria]